MNEANKNKPYPKLDAEISATYLKLSEAQKFKYDMYMRFVSWASGRVNENGIVAFITNNSFIRARSLSGMRRTITKEYSAIYIIDLLGDAITSGELRKDEGGNIFENKIKEGVAISFFVKEKNNKSKTRIKIFQIAKRMSYLQKRAFIEDHRLKDISFVDHKLDLSGDWVPLDAPDDPYNGFIPVIDKKVKQTKVSGQERAIFKSFSNGMNTARDDWAYDFSEEQLLRKIKYFCEVYNNSRRKVSKLKTVEEASRHIDQKIKWSRDLIAKAFSNKGLVLDEKAVNRVLFRPFAEKIAYVGDDVIDVKSLADKFFPPDHRNVCIAIDRGGKNFSALAIRSVPDWHFLGDTTYFGLYSYSEGERHDNVTDWALQLFRKTYKDKEITKDDIFYYVYAVFYDVAFVEENRHNLCNRMPKIPMLPNFHPLKKLGRALVELHSEVERQPSATEVRLHKKTGIGKPKLKYIEADGHVILDEFWKLTGVSLGDHEFKLGSRNPIQWVLEAAKPQRLNASSENKEIISENFGAYPWKEIRSRLSDLIPKLVYVCSNTSRIIAEIAALVE